MPFDFGTIDTGDTAWVLTSAALVLVMTPGLAFFYGGMVRVENVLSMIRQNFFCMGIVSVLWVLVTYSPAFGGANGFVGGFDHVGLDHMNVQVAGYTGPAAQTIPSVVFVCFQLMFAVITPALITGASADRFRFSAFAMFIALWSVLVYGLVAHWVFSPTGWLYEHGAEDFAGGTVVHANAGSALHADELAGSAFVNTNTAAACAMLGWILVERLRDAMASTLGAASGAVAGLVAITPAAGYVTPVGSIVIGFLAGGACALATAVKGKVGIDDALDVGAVHLVGGALGALLIGLLGSSDIGGRDGVFYGGGSSLLREQVVAVAAVVAYSFAASLIIAGAVRLVHRLRVTPDEEIEGLDTTQHSEVAYRL